MAPTVAVKASLMPVWVLPVIGMYRGDEDGGTRCGVRPTAFLCPERRFLSAAGEWWTHPFCSRWVRPATLDIIVPFL